MTQYGRHRNRRSSDRRVWRSCLGSRPFDFLASRFITAFSIKHPQCTISAGVRCVQYSGSTIFTFSARIMEDRMVQAFKEYEEQLWSSDNVPRFSYGRRMMRDDGDPKTYFLTYLFWEQSMAIQFLQDIGLLRCKMKCNTCGRHMTWLADRNITEGFRCHLRYHVWTSSLLTILRLGFELFFLVPRTYDFAILTIPILTHHHKVGV